MLARILIRTAARVFRRYARLVDATDEKALCSLSGPGAPVAAEVRPVVVAACRALPRPLSLFDRAVSRLQPATSPLPAGDGWGRDLDHSFNARRRAWSWKNGDRESLGSAAALRKTDQ